MMFLASLLGLAICIGVAYMVFFKKSATPENLSQLPVREPKGTKSP